MPEGGDFVLFFDPEAGVLHRKAVPGVRILTEKLVARGLAGEGMVTGQTDTCIIIARKLCEKALNYVAV